MPTAFETHARQLRYQAIGSACHKLGINTLLLGHHLDDNVETTLARLSKGAGSFGLRGMSQIARIPECNGLFGIAESGSSRKAFSKEDINHKATSGSPSLPSVSVADGGIFLCRPLLAFPKSRLLDTCHAQDIPYVSDPTNFDPTLTYRNAIREMRASHSLPRALQAPRLDLLCQTSRQKVNTYVNLSNRNLASNCRILEFDWEAGSMKLEVLHEGFSRDQVQETFSEERMRGIQAFSLRRITELVSPHTANYFPLNSYQQFVSSVFDAPGQSNYAKSNADKRFTLGGTFFDLKSENDEGKVWSLSRQPFMKGRNPISHLSVPIMPFGETTPKPASNTSLRWTLWDNRYWLKISASFSEPSDDSEKDDHFISIAIRGYQQGDMQNFRDSTSTNDKVEGSFQAAPVDRLKKILRSRAHAAKFTIPILTREESSASNESLDKADYLLALPTLGFSFAQPFNSKANKTEILHKGRKVILTWEWQYKMIDFEAVRLMNGPIE